jgi:cell division protein FtsW (lipid II flippase)
MTTPTKPSDTDPGRAWARWIFWAFAAVALLLLVLEHRAHVLGWWLHALLGLCVVLLYLVIRADSGGDGDGPR